MAPALINSQRLQPTGSVRQQFW